MGVKARMSFVGSALLMLLLVSCGGGDTRSLSIQGPAISRQGEVVRFQVVTADLSVFEEGEPALWSVEPASAGLITPEGRFVGYEPGEARIRVLVSGVEDVLPIFIEPRNGRRGEFQVLFAGNQTARYNSDLWVHDRFAYTGSWQGGAVINLSKGPGDRMFAWDIGNPVSPLMTDEVIVDARTVNDVKIRADGRLAVITHEGASDGLNGITFLDLLDPFHPREIGRFTDELTSGVHNVWIEGDFVYAVADGVGRGLRIIRTPDVDDPLSVAQVVARFVAETSFLHDVLVRDGLAFLSHWDAGLIILDVGNGIAGGSPTDPVEVGRIRTEGGQVHNAWYWPQAGYVFVGEEDFLSPGYLHVVDVGDLFDPIEVAAFRVPGETPHNFWVDEDRGILYAAWYTQGLRAVDVRGELLGDLHKQDREIAFIRYGTDAGCQSADGTCTWAPQLHDGLVYASDMNTGLWVFRPLF